MWRRRYCVDIIDISNPGPEELRRYFRGITDIFIPISGALCRYCVDIVDICVDIVQYRRRSVSVYMDTAGAGRSSPPLIVTGKCWVRATAGQRLQISTRAGNEPSRSLKFHFSHF